MTVATTPISPISVLRGERNLGPLEHAFREYSLKADVNQIIGMGWILIAGTFVYAIFDNPPQTLGPHFWVTLFVRAGLVSFSLFSIRTLQRTTSYRFADWWIFVWSLAVVVYALYDHTNTIAELQKTVLGDLILVIGFYTVFPNRFYFRAIPALLLSVGDVVLLWLIGNHVSLDDLTLVAVSLFFGNLTGSYISVYLYTYRRNQFIAQLQEQQARLENERLATLDGLTQIYNRRCFMEMLRQEFERYQRYRRPFSLLMMDLDYFKRINDTFGHPAGDAVLQGFAGLIPSLIRTNDTLARLGGEEFAVLLPETPAESALQFAGRIREQCEQLTFSDHSSKLHITASIGVTQVQESDTSPEDTLRRADRALYFVKEHGRNDVHVLV